jgi:hypothetical protein
MAKDNRNEIVISMRTGAGSRWVYAVFGAVTAWSLTAGFFLIFSIFPPYDDEGYLMMTTRRFLNGGILYDDIYTQYGPSYYLYKWAVFGISGLPVTHDITRLTTLIIWTMIALACSIFTYRNTRSTLFGAISYVLSFLILSRTVAEPGHPQDICGLIIISGLLLLVSEETISKTNIAFLAVLVAVLCLIKINLGVLFGLALAITLVTFMAHGRWQRVVQIGLTIAAAILPYAMFRKYFEFGWLRMSIVVSAALIAVCLISLQKTKTPAIFARDIFLMAICFLATLVVILLATLSMGTSFSALVNGILLQHLKFGDDFYQSASIQRFSAIWGIFALAVSLLFVYLKHRFPAKIEIIATLLKTAFGLSVICCSVAGYGYFLNSFLLLSFATPFLWILLIGQPESGENRVSDLPRTALVLTAILTTLQIFPIAGTQMAYATFLMTVIGTICLHDGLSSLKTLSEASGLRTVLNTGLSIALAAFCIYWGYENYARYYRQVPLALPGASLVRLPENDVSTFKSLAADIDANCDNFITMPGMYSLYFWTHKDSPTNLNATAWMSLLDDSQQQSVVEKLKTIPHLCAVYHPQQTQNGSRNRDLAKSPLASYILGNFKTKSEVNEYRLMVRNEAAQ